MPAINVTGNHLFVKFVRPYPEELFRGQMQYRVKSYHFIPSVRNGTWDGYVTLIKAHKITAGLYRAMKPKFEQQGITFHETIQWPGPPPRTAGLTSSRPHQNECVSAMLDSIVEGGGTVVAATASGKTATAAIFYSYVDGNHLFIVDQRKLLYQAQADIAEFLGETVGIVGDGKFVPGRVTVATVQTLRSAGKLERLNRYLGALETVIVDELHVQLSRSNFDIVRALQPRARFGMTATLQMEDQEVWLRVCEFSGPVIYTYPIERGIREGVLSPAHYYQIKFKPRVTDTELRTNRDILKLEKQGPRSKQLTVKIDQWEQNVLDHKEKYRALRMLVRGYLKRNRYIVVLADKLKHIDRIARVLDEFDPMIISGRVKMITAQDYIDRFECGENRLIVASRVFNKGISIKRIDVIINVGETEDANTIVQQIGRELRLHDDKAGAIFVDFGTTTGRFGKAARARVLAVKAAGLPTAVYSWDRDQDRFFKAVAPPLRTTGVTQ